MRHTGCTGAVDLLVALLLAYRIVLDSLHRCMWPVASTIHLSDLNSHNFAVYSFLALNSLTKKTSRCMENVTGPTVMDTTTKVQHFCSHKIPEVVLCGWADLVLVDWFSWSDAERPCGWKDRNGPQSHRTQTAHGGQSPYVPMRWNLSVSYAMGILIVTWL